MILLPLLAGPAAQPLLGHMIGDPAHDGATPAYDFRIGPPMAAVAIGPGNTRAALLLAAASPGDQPSRATQPLAQRPPQADPLAARVAAIFAPFAPSVRTRSDERFLYVESDSMPDHPMMVGITAWQQQVPLPQPYTGDNAWRIPLYPVASQNPMSAKSHFFRGAIALAANGVPIYNPIKNDGRTDTFLAGELDQYGGHCGRADDYHYHIAPTHLQEIVGSEKPVAYALDGYPIYGFKEPDGTTPKDLDAFNGHTTPALGYHYHSTKNYPYLNGGFHGEVVERDGQADPQPRTGGVRPALPPWRGARITGFRSQENKSFSVEIQADGKTHHVNYTINPDGTVKFDFIDGDGDVRSETFSPRQRGGGGPARGKEKGGRKGKRGGDPQDPEPPPPNN